MSCVLEASYEYIKFEYYPCDILNVGVEIKNLLVIFSNLSVKLLESNKQMANDNIHF